MSTGSLQTQLFNHLRNKLGQEISLVDEVATVLDISIDSAYRRIRGEKFISFEELHRLCTHYRLSMDALLDLKTDRITFQGQYVDASSFRFETYLAEVEKQVRYLASFQRRIVHYLCKDIPLFHHYHFKELAAFKYFFWQKTLLQSPEFATQTLSLDRYPGEIFEVGRKALAHYNCLDSHEIWNIESVNSTLRQVEYFHDTRAFADREDLRRVYEALDRLFFHLETQAELGYKFEAGDADRKPLGKFQMYVNEVAIGDNSVLALLDGTKVCFLTHTGINFMLTRDVGFCENMHAYYSNLMRKSTLISVVSERERSKFFKVVHNRIALRRQNLEK